MMILSSISAWSLAVIEVALPKSICITMTDWDAARTAPAHTIQNRRDVKVPPMLSLQISVPGMYCDRYGAKNTVWVGLGTKDDLAYPSCSFLSVFVGLLELSDNNEDDLSKYHTLQGIIIQMSKWEEESSAVRHWTGARDECSDTRMMRSECRHGRWGCRSRFQSSSSVSTILISIELENTIGSRKQDCRDTIARWRRQTRAPLQPRKKACWITSSAAWGIAGRAL